MLALRPCRARPLYMRAGLPSDSSALLWRLSIQSRGGASLPLAQLPLTSERDARLCRAARSSAWRKAKWRSVYDTRWHGPAISEVYWSRLVRTVRKSLLTLSPMSQMPL